MRCFVGLVALALLGTFDPATAGRCKPSNLVVKNLVSNGNFRERDPNDSSGIPGFTVVGLSERIEGEGYTGDGSTEKSCVRIQASNVAGSKHKRASAVTAGISQDLFNLDPQTLYTVRFFYAIVTGPSSLNICQLNAYLGTNRFFSSWILSMGQSISWATVLLQTNVLQSEAPISIYLSCFSGGVSMIYIDSIFLSNQVTPANINRFSIDFGNGDASSGPITTATSATATSTSDSSNSLSSISSSGTGAGTTTSETSSTDTTVSETSTSTSSETSSPDTTTPESSTTVSETSSYSETITESTSTPKSTNVSHTPSGTSLPGTPSNEAASSTSTDSTSTTTTSSSSSMTSDGSVCPVGIDPPGGCTARPGMPSQSVSIVGINPFSFSDGQEPQVDRTCWAFGVKKNGYFGQTYNSNNRQNSIEDCALLCKQKENCRAFAFSTIDGNECALSYYKLAIEGITLDLPYSLMWNDLDCFECVDCEKGSTQNTGTLQTTATNPTTTTAALTTTMTTNTQASEATSCLTCQLKASLPSNFICNKLGTPTIDPFYYPESETGPQRNAADCAAICIQFLGCHSSAFEVGIGACVFSGSSAVPAGWVAATQEDHNMGTFTWSANECWTCSEECSSSSSSATFQSTASTAATTLMTTTSSASSTFSTFTQTPTPTTPQSTPDSATMADRPQCTLALSSGCGFQDDFNGDLCIRYGNFASSFTLEDGEYPWYIETHKCDGLCWHMPSRCKATAWSDELGKCVFSSHSIFDSSFIPSNVEGTLTWFEQSCSKCDCSLVALG
ncbi:hypothetical protein B0T10DRAFT_416214 [Thelonectria olida]|uniref:Apple domain-containing protein n=1 Tax=Thelonectria olida TaxID=1576542 RepID=A0A9P8VTV2_9HYPO|nr:hypothetical protein B0T10DRAFT_416214 [Thelonectria olida]